MTTQDQVKEIMANLGLDINNSVLVNHCCYIFLEGKIAGIKQISEEGKNDE